MNKLKISLINPDYMLYADPPLGLAYLASYARKNLDFVDINILDQLTEIQILDKIKKLNPDIIGLNAVSLNFLKVKNLALKIKKISSAILVLGGIHITTSPISFENSPFDIAVIGEGERTFLELLKNLNKNNKKLNINELKKIKGFLLREKVKKREKIINTGLPDLIENLDEIPLPARDLLNMKYYTLPQILSSDDFDHLGAIITSRGCPYSCPFCSSSCFWTRRIRFFSAKRVAEEIELLCNKYGYRKLFIYDDLFTFNKARLREIIKLLEEKKFLGKIVFDVYGRADVFDDEIAGLLEKMNVKKVIFGFESGSQRTLDYLKEKRVKVSDNIKAIKICQKHNLEPGGFFMIGSPHETEEDIKQTHDFIRDYCPDAIVYQTIPFPGTEIWDYAVKNKIVTKDFYDHKQKDWVDVDTDFLLSKDISKEKFKYWFYKIKNLYIPTARMSLFKRLSKLRARHISGFLSITFLRKAINLREQFTKRVIVKPQKLEKN